MRILTLQEPWASLIGEGIKTIETRSWPCNQFGELYIHAGSTKISSKEPRKKELSSWLSGPCHYGTIFAKCNLVDCIKITAEFANHITLAVIFVGIILPDVTHGYYQILS